MFKKRTLTENNISDSLRPRAVALQALLSMEFSRQKYWSGKPFPSSGDLPDPGIEPKFSALQAGSLPSEPPGRPLVVKTVVTDLQR